jgi:ribosomal-protein-alanine N-acetyltransferase
MRDAPEAPVWSDDDLVGLARVAPVDQRKVRKVWVAEESSSLTGFVVATALSVPDTRAECELEFVLVPAQARRQGIGGALVLTVVAWARDLGAAEIWLEVRESNKHALRLYQRCGFSITGRRPGYYVDPLEDAVLMRRQIECDREDAPV